MGLRELIFGAPKLVEDVFDSEKGLLVKAGGFINNLHYSEQEKAVSNSKLADSVLDHVKATAGESTEKSKARRELAVKWIDLQINLIGVTVICVPLAVLFPTQGEKMFNLIFSITTSKLLLGGTITVMAYFFGTYGWGTYISKKGGKK